MQADDLDLHAGLDGLQQDMSEHQRRVGSEPTAEANRVLAAQLFERIERQDTDAKVPAPRSSPAPTDANRDKVAVAGGTERREGQHGRYIVSKSLVDDTKMRLANAPEHWFMTHAMPRAQLLLTKQDTGPLGQASWRTRTLAVMEVHSRIGPLRMAGRHVEAGMLERRFMHEFLELLEASNAVFGEWKSDAPTRISVSG